MTRQAWSLFFIVGCIALWPLAGGAQEAPLDNGSEAFFDSIGGRPPVTSWPPAANSPAVWPPALTALHEQAPQPAEERQVLLRLDFDTFDFAANRDRLLLLEPGRLSLAPDDKGGKALVIDSLEPVLAGIARGLDPDQLAGRIVELSARVKLLEPYRLPADPKPFDRPTIQIRWERLHPDPARRVEGDTLREWRTVLDGPLGRRPAAFLPDGAFHTYRTRFAVPTDVVGVMLQAVVHRAAATMLVDDLEVAVITTPAERRLREDLDRGGNLIDRFGTFELGLAGVAVSGERRLARGDAPGAVERDFGQHRIVTGDSPQGSAHLAVTTEPGLGAAVELPWVGLAAGEPHVMSVWMRASRPDVVVAFGVGDPAWEVLGRLWELDTEWRRYAAPFTPGRALHHAWWPWLTIDPAADSVTVEIDGLQIERAAKAGPFQEPPGVQIDIDTGWAPAPGLRHVFTPSDELQIVAKLTHGRPQSRAVQLRAVLESHSGRLFRELTEVSETVRVQPGRVAEAPLWTGPLPPGLYRFWVVATDRASGESSLEEQTVAVFAPPRQMRFGYHDGPGRPERTAAVAASGRRVGANLIRTGTSLTADWRTFWLGPENYDWALLDDYLNGWQAQQVEVLFTLGPRLDRLPAWLTEQAPHRLRPSTRNESVLVPNTDLWAEYVRAVVTRYRDQVTAWEVLSGVDRQLDPSEYLQLLQAAAAIIRDVDPGAKVVAPGLHRALSAGPAGWLEDLLAAGAAASLDVVSTQFSPPYPEALDAARDNLRRLAEVHGFQIWDTRHGYEEPPLRTDRFNPRGLLDRRLLPFSEHPYDAAAFYSRHELLLAAAGYQRSIVAPGVAELISINEPVGTMCETDGSPRSGLAALSVVAALIGEAAPLGEWRWDFSLPAPRASYDYRRPQGVRAVAFATGEDTATVAIWTFQRDATVTVTIPEAAGAEAFLATGEPVAVGRDGACLVTASPLYLRGLPRAVVNQLPSLAISGRLPDQPGAQPAEPTAEPLAEDDAV